MQHIELSPKNWAILSKKLQDDYPKSVVAIKEKCKRTLGFTRREYLKRFDNKHYALEMEEINAIIEKDPNYWYAPPSKYDYEKVICLDFYDDVKKTFFLLKYSEFLCDS
jgi:hypothetical protein